MFQQYNEGNAPAQSDTSVANQLTARRRTSLGFLFSPANKKPAVSSENGVSLRAATRARKPSETAVMFLQTLDPDGRHNLVAIDPNKKVRLEGRTFKSGAWDEMAAWIDEREGRLNIYFSVNEPAADAPHDKLGKDEISSIRAVHVDVDPTDEQIPDLTIRRAHTEAERIRLRALIDSLNVGALPPSIAVDSGNGVYPIWLLSKKLDAKEWREAVEAQNRGVAKALDGDSAHDISRILRLPGTTNIPDVGKRAKGRSARSASVLSNRDARYTLEQIAARYEPVSKTEQTDKSPEIDRLMKAIDLAFVTQSSTYDELPPELRRKFEEARAASPKLDALWVSGISSGKDKTASGRHFELARRLKAADFLPDEYGAFLWVWEHATSAAKGRVEEWEDGELQRVIARCWERSSAGPDPFEWFDEIADDLAEPAPSPVKSARLLELVTFADASASALERSSKPLVKGFLDQGALSVLYGESNVGKTFVAMDIAFHIGAGMDWSGRRTARMGVVYVAAEGGNGARRRAMALAKQYGEDVAYRARFRFHLGGVNLLRADADLSPLIETVRACGDVGLIVIDTLSRALAGGNENDSSDMGALVKHIDYLRQATGAHVMLVHHSGKKRDRGARGHSLLRAATDTEIEIADNEISVTKQRDMEGDFRRAFVLDTVVLGKDADGDLITSCTVRLVSHDEKPAGEPSAGEAEVLAVLSALHEDNMSTKGFRLEEISQGLATNGGPIPSETVRTRLRSMKNKRLVEQPKSGFWLAKRTICPGGNASTALLQPLDSDE